MKPRARKPRIRGAAWSCGLLLLAAPACSVHTAIEREPSGEYVIAGFRGSEAQVWIGDYDPTTKTLHVKKIVRGQ